MRKLSWSSTFVLAVVAALALPTGCGVQDTSTHNTSDDVARGGGGGGGGSGPSCDDFDTYCGANRPCGEGFVCELDTSNCGSNFFGTFPDCGVTATCYPTCQPK